MRYNMTMARNTLAVLSYKRAVDRHLIASLHALAKILPPAPWMDDALKRISTFAVAGKSVRGSLVVYSYALFQTHVSTEVLDTAAALELLQSGLLIHDDIMDEDTIRRGMPSLHSQYEQFAASQHGNTVAHFGTSQAINLGNLCYFLAYRLLDHSNSSVLRYISTELSAVTIAQMQDVAGGHLNTHYDQETVLHLYRHKTARYTFSLPLVIGGIMANAPKTILAPLEKMGESMGLLYQIRDDELNATGTVSSIGKSVQGDIRHHKQTLRTILSPEELASFSRKLQIEAKNIIRSLPVSAVKQQELMRLLAFCETRNA